MSDLNLLSKGVVRCSNFNFFPVGEGASASRTAVVTAFSVVLNFTGSAAFVVMSLLIVETSVRVVRRRITADV